WRRSPLRPWLSSGSARPVFRVPWPVIATVRTTTSFLDRAAVRAAMMTASGVAAAALVDRADLAGTAIGSSAVEAVKAPAGTTNVGVSSTLRALAHVTDESRITRKATL